MNDHAIIGHIQAAVMCLLVPVEVRPNRRRPATAISLQSFLRKEGHCQAGNLLQIHFVGGATQAKCDGTSTKSLTTSKSQSKLHYATVYTIMLLLKVPNLRRLLLSQ